MADPVSGLTLDTGALLAVERADPRVRALLRRADEHGLLLSVPAGVVAQVWRGGARQAVVARVLNGATTTVVVLDDAGARAVGVLCGRAGHADVVDASVALCARERGDAVVSSDPDDLRTLDPHLRIISV